MGAATEPKLTLKQRLFVDAYLGVAAGNATEAARIAKYAGNENTLSQTGLQNLRKPNIAYYVEKKITESAMSADEVLKELAAIAKCDWKDFIEIRFDDEGEAIDAKLKLSDKIKALELLGKHFKLFSDKVEVSGPAGGAIEIATRVIEPAHDDES